MCELSGPFVQESILWNEWESEKSKGENEEADLISRPVRYIATDGCKTSSELQGVLRLEGRWRKWIKGGVNYFKKTSSEISLGFGIIQCQKIKLRDRLVLFTQSCLIQLEIDLQLPH